MQTQNSLTVINPKYVKWNNNDLDSIKNAERRKTMFENKGYTLRHQMVNSITGECTFTYESEPSTPPVSELPEPSKKDAIKNACETIYALMNGEYDHLGLVEIGHLFLLDETNIQKILAHYNVSAEQFILVRQNDCKQLAETLSLYAQKNGTQQHEITQLQEHNRVLRVALEQISKRLNAFGYEGELNYQDREIVIDMHLSVMTTLNAPYLK